MTVAMLAQGFFFSSKMRSRSPLHPHPLAPVPKSAFIPSYNESTRKKGTRRASDDDGKLQQELWQMQQQLDVREQQLVSQRDLQVTELRARLGEETAEAHSCRLQNDRIYVWVYICM